jgi:hypothetical protein
MFSKGTAELGWPPVFNWVEFITDRKRELWHPAKGHVPSMTMAGALLPGTDFTVARSILRLHIRSRTPLRLKAVLTTISNLSTPP